MSALIARLSVRLRVTLAFAAVMALVLAATGLFFHIRLRDTLRGTLDSALTTRANDIAALISQSRTSFAAGANGPLEKRPDNFAQILDTRGHVLDATSGLGSRRLLTPAQLRAAASGGVRTTLHDDQLDDNKVRLYARSVEAGNGRLVVIVGSSLESNDEAVDELGDLLWLGLPVALALAAIAGYVAITAALVPVERMRRRASVLSHSSDERLPVPQSHDEIARLGVTLNEMLDRLEETYRREQQFVSDASHELRTPLAILKAELELALRDADTAEAYRAAIESAAEETDRVVDLAEDLLVIARADQGRLPMRGEAIDAEQLFASVASRFARRAEEAGIGLSAYANGVELHGDARLVEQAVGNLVDNAIRHARSSVELHAEGSSIVVRDDGDGFPPEFLPVAFERFTRADHARARGGTGLGLAMVEAIATAHHGAVGARNVEGGTEVSLRLGAASAPAVLTAR